MGRGSKGCGLPGSQPSPSTSGAWNLPGPWPRPPRRARRSGAPWGPHRTVGSSPGWGLLCLRPPWPVRSLVGMCRLSRLQLLPDPTGESPESKRPGTGSRAPVSPGRREPVGRATGGRSGRGPGRAEQGQRPRSRAQRSPGAWSPRAEEACPGREPPLGPENVGRGRGREGDLEEDPASDVRSPPGSFS